MFGRKKVPRGCQAIFTFQQRYPFNPFNNRVRICPELSGPPSVVSYLDAHRVSKSAVAFPVVLKNIRRLPAGEVAAILDLEIAAVVKMEGFLAGDIARIACSGGRGQGMF